MKNARNVLVTVLVVIAGGLAFGVYKGFIPPRAGTEGAIGAAQRYTSPQISDTDVQLSDPSTQAFLQSDLFHAIATNPDFRSVITKDAFKKTVQVEGMLDLAAQDFGHGGKDFHQLVASEDFQKVNKSADFKKAIKDQKVQNLLSNADFQTLIASEDFQKLAGKIKDAKASGTDARNILVDEKITKTKEWMALSASEDFNQVLANEDFLAAEANTDMAKIIKENAKLFASADFNKVLASEDFQKLVASEDFQKMAKSPEFQKVWASTDFQKVAANHDFQKIAKGDLAAAVAASEDMSKAQGEK